MAEVGGQERQFALGVLIGPIPAHECVRGESVSQVVQTWAMTVRGASQADLPGQHVKRSTDICTVQLMAPAGNEQVGGHRSLPPVVVAATDVLSEHAAGRSMHRHQPSLAELSATDSQRLGLEIDILKLEVAGFADTQPRDTQESEQTVVDPGPQLSAFIAAWQGKRGAQQVANFRIRVQVGSRPLGPEWQQAECRDLRVWIGRAAVACKSSDKGQPLSPMRRLSMRWLLRPGQRQRLGDVGRAVLLHEPAEID